jgi:hypothetical protein
MYEAAGKAAARKATFDAVVKLGSAAASGMQTTQAPAPVEIRNV